MPRPYRLPITPNTLISVRELSSFLRVQPLQPLLCGSRTRRSPSPSGGVRQAIDSPLSMLQASWAA
jgi:hypothetical protein